MDEKEFQNLNAKIHKRREQITSRESARESASRIMEKTLSIPQTDPEVIKRYHREKLRKERSEFVQSRRRQLSKAIPDLFLYGSEKFPRAHRYHLGEKFWNCMTDYHFGIVLYGSTGNGKSFALCALLRYLIIEHRFSAKRISHERLCQQIRGTYKAKSDITEDDICRPLINCDILVLEDLGAGRGVGQEETDFSNRILLIILDARIENIKPTFISTNKSPDNLSKSLDERLASRLSLFKWIGVGGKDKRNEKG